MLLTHRDPRLVGLDTKLHTAIVQMLISKPGDDTSQRILTRIYDVAAPNCGRQAFRVIDADFQRYSLFRRRRALTQFYNLGPCTDINKVEASITELKNILLELRGFPECPAEAMLVSKVREMYGANSKLSNIFTWPMAAFVFAASCSTFFSKTSICALASAILFGAGLEARF